MTQELGYFCFCSLLGNYITLTVSISEILNIMRVGFLLQALLKLVADCAVVALNPSRKDAVNESPLKIALFSLAKMCSHPLCKQFLSSSELFPVIGRLRQSPESTIAQYASVIINKVSDARGPRESLISQWSPENTVEVCEEAGMPQTVSVVDVVK